MLHQGGRHQPRFSRPGRRLVGLANLLIFHSVRYIIRRVGSPLTDTHVRAFYQCALKLGWAAIRPVIYENTRTSHTRRCSGVKTATAATLHAKYVRARPLPRSSVQCRLQRLGEAINPHNCRLSNDTNQVLKGCNYGSVHTHFEHAFL